MGENINVFKRGHKEGKKEGTGRTLTEGRKRAKKKRAQRAFKEGKGGHKEGKTRNCNLSENIFSQGFALGSSASH